MVGLRENLDQQERKKSVTSYVSLTGTSIAAVMRGVSMAGTVCLSMCVRFPALW